MDQTDAEQCSETSLPPLPVGVLCPDCGYDLRGLTSDRCPECGFGLDVLRARESLIPWSHRRELGTFRAYWKTVWWVARYPKRFWREMARPVSYRDSQSFRWVSSLHAYLPILIGSVLWCVFDHLRGWQGGEALWWVLGSLQVVSLVLLAGLPGLASYFFQSPHLSVEQQNRAIALSYYAWASVAWTPLALPFFALALLTWKPWGNVHGVLFCVIAGICFGCAETWQATLYWFSKHNLHRGRAACLLRIMVLNMLALGLALLALLLPLNAFYLLVIYHSFG